MLSLEDSAHPRLWPEDKELFDFDELPAVGCDQRASSNGDFASSDDLPPDCLGRSLSKDTAPDPEADVSELTVSTAASEEPWETQEPAGFRVALLNNSGINDLAPLLALAKLLKQRHVVCVFTNVDLVPTCAEHGVDAVAIYADLVACMREVGGVVPQFRQTARSGLDAARKWLREHPGACRGAEEALSAFLPDVLVCTPGAYTTGLRFERASCVPMVPLVLQRAVPDLMRDIFFVKPSRPCFFAMSEHAFSVRMEVLRNAFSLRLDLHFTGAWVLETAPTAQQQEALEAFLGAGDAPVAIAWSMILRDRAAPELLDLALQGLRLAGRRGVVIGGWAQLDKLGEELQQREGEDADFARRRLLFLPEAAESWLFPRCRCVVHTGGSSTMANAMRAGVPSVVTPVLDDEQVVSKSVREQGLGVGFRDTLDRLSAESLAWALRQSEAFAVKAKWLAAVVREEPGAEQGASVLEDFLEKEVQTGRWAREALMAWRTKQ